MQVQLNPTGVLNLLSQLEVDLLAQSTTDRYRLFRNCALAVLNVGSHTDSSAEIYDRFQDFDIRLVARERGIKIELTNPPETAFVDGDIIPVQSIVLETAADESGQCLVCCRLTAFVVY